MAIRDHFRVDVLVRDAARLQAAHVELAEVGRLLHLHDAGVAGMCPSIRARHARAPVGWRCGRALLATPGLVAASFATASGGVLSLPSSGT
jgi:hypothetical protein